MISKNLSVVLVHRTCNSPFFFFSLFFPFVYSISESHLGCTPGTLPFSLIDGQQYLNYTACHLYACQQGVLHQKKLPSCTLPAQSGGLVLTSHGSSSKSTSCQVVNNNGGVDQLPDGNGTAVHCNWCRCHRGKLHCTHRTCGSGSNGHSERCRKCYTLPLAPVCASNMQTFATACHAVNCSGLHEEALLHGACPQTVSP